MFSKFFKSSKQTKNKKDEVPEIEIENEETQEKTSSVHKEIESRLKLENMKLIDEELATMTSQDMFKKYWKEKLCQWKLSSLNDEWRLPDANKSTGGIDWKDKEVVSLLRNTSVEMIKQIGKKMLSGDFNLTTVSFPIKIMLPLSILEMTARSVFQHPIYFNLAATQGDPLEKFKLTIVGIISCYHDSSFILKPLNPILGETYEMLYEDGSKIYLEQSSHHPPVTHFLLNGPNKLYKYHGYSLFSSSAGLNSLKLLNKGKRAVEFLDGTKICFDFCNDLYSNTFIGKVRHETVGEHTIKDLTNGFECTLKFKGVKKKPSDFIAGDIKLKGQTVSKVYGTYLGFVEFDGVRYWDARENVGIKYIMVPNQLPSSSVYRTDRLLLEKKNLEEAQKAKDKLEEIQRRDRKLKEKFAKLGSK